jgi:UDP-GlcNAc:undecaprenyl-phosphate GlcNAc-1-phosphate transferase
MGMQALADAATDLGVLTADQVLSHYIYVFYAAFLVAFVFTPIMRVVATYYGVIDEPDQIRKMHSRPVAYLGGVAVFLGWMAGLATSQFVGTQAGEVAMHSSPLVDAGILVSAAIVIMLGLWDDIRGVGPWVKIALQALAAIFLLSRGIGTHCARALLDPVGVYTTHFLGFSIATPAVVLVSSSLLTIFIVVLCCNATNLMDGLDGLCGGVTAIIAFGFCFIAVELAKDCRTFPLDNLAAIRIVLALSLLGAVLGFVPYNFNPASIFMGDAGSMFLGFCCATLIILCAEQRELKWFLASVVMFALPLLDTVLAFARRTVNRRAVFSADHHHFHHQLIARGLTVKQTVLFAYSLAIFFVVGGGAIAFLPTRYVVAAYLVIFGFIAVAAFKMGMVHELPRSVTRKSLDQSAVSPRGSAMEPANVIDIRVEPRASSGGDLNGIAGTWEKPEEPVQGHAPSGPPTHA